MALGVQETVARLLVASLLAGIIGLERESSHRAAGLRTHILVGVGSTLMMIISAYGFAEFPLTGRDPARLAAQVVSGIGFLGAGTILREGITIRGLTTAASLWVVAGIGLSVGIGLYLPALVTTALVTVALLFLKPVERFVNPVRGEENYTLKIAGRTIDLVQLEGCLAALGVAVKRADLKYLSEEDASLLFLTLAIPDRLGTVAVTQRLGCLNGVLEVRMED
ncbi:MAG: MgtC/SapB family protein [Bacillota bacterium]|nr:MgtC/SapB family protein [Bacillota bacterium]